MSMDDAYEYLERGDYERALPLLLREFQNGNYNWNSLYLTGQSYRFLKDFVSAEKFLAKSISLKNDEAPVHHALGVVHQLMDKLDLSLESFQRAIEIDPSNYFAYNSTALTCKKMGRLVDADHFYGKAVHALFIRIISKADVIEIDEAMLSEHPRGELWIDLVTDIVRDRFYKKRIVDNEKLLEVSSEYFGWMPKFFSVLKNEKEYITVLRNRAIVLGELGRTDEAEALYKEAEAFE